MDQRPLPPVAIIAYSAGLLDGEGWIAQRLDRPRVAGCSQSVANGGKELCEWLREQWGIGHVRPQTGYCPMYVWHIDRLNDIRWFLTALLPYLRVKRKRAEELLAAMESWTGGRSRGRWTEFEDGIIRSNWKKRDGEIAELLGNGRSPNAITLRRRSLGIRKPLNGFPKSVRDS